MIGRKILLADDEPHVRVMLQKKLESAGFTVVGAIDGREALEISAEFLPDLVISDLQMPRMTGLEFCIGLRQNPLTAKVPAIMLTSRGDVLSPEQTQAAGIRQLLDKPFSPRQVLALAQSILSTENVTNAAV